MSFDLTDDEAILIRKQLQKKSKNTQWVIDNVGKINPEKKKVLEKSVSVYNEILVRMQNQYGGEWGYSDK